MARRQPIHALAGPPALWSQGSAPSQWVTDAGAFVHGVFTGPSGLLAPVAAIGGAAGGAPMMANVGMSLAGRHQAASPMHTVDPAHWQPQRHDTAGWGLWLAAGIVGIAALGAGAYVLTRTR